MFQFILDENQIRDISDGLLNEEEIQRKAKFIINSTAHMAAEQAAQYAPKGKPNSQSYENYKPGNLKKSFRVIEAIKTDNLMTAEVFSEASYAEAVESGSGIHGPTGNMISSPTGKNMIMGKEGRDYINSKKHYPDLKPRRYKKRPPFVQATRGQKGQRFFRRAYEDANVYMQALIKMFEVEIRERKFAIGEVGTPSLPGPSAIPAPPSRPTGPSKIFSKSGKSEIVTTGNLKKGTFATKSFKDSIIDIRLEGGGPGGGQFTKRGATVKEIQAQRRRARKRRK